MKILKSKPVNPRKLLCNPILVSLLILATSIVLFCKPILIYYGEWLSPSNPQPVADVVISLAGGENRLETAVSLLANGQVKALYTDVIAPHVLQEVVTKNGLPSSNIYWGGNPKNTFDEALAFSRTMNSANFPYHQVVIVSDRYHLRRSLWAFRQVLSPDVKIMTHATPADEVMSDPCWWKHQQSRDWVVSETKKSLFYYLYYGLFGSRIPISPSDLVSWMR